MTKIRCNGLVLRQTKESPYSYYGTSVGHPAQWRTLEAHVEECVDEPEKLGVTLKQGYLPGVLIISMPFGVIGDSRFYSGVVQLTPETPLVARFGARNAGEEPFLEVLANARKTEATCVDIILYSRDLLREEGVHVPDNVDYEIVSINARTQEAPQPMHPVTMMRNFFGLAGGTQATYTAEQFAEAIRFWSQHAMTAD
jgi:hypothetical protein